MQESGMGSEENMVLCRTVRAHTYSCWKRSKTKKHGRSKHTSERQSVRAELDTIARYALRILFARVARDLRRGKDGSRRVVGRLGCFRLCGRVVPGDGLQTRLRRLHRSTATTSTESGLPRNETSVSKTITTATSSFLRHVPSALPHTIILPLFRAQTPEERREMKEEREKKKETQLYEDVVDDGAQDYACRRPRPRTIELCNL